MRKSDLSHKTFGRLTALLPTSLRCSQSILWHCHCLCGKTAFVSARELKRGNTRSCGCQDLESARKHNFRKVKQRDLPRGVSKTREGKYVALISIDNQVMYLGTFLTPSEAHEAYLRAAK